MDPLRLVEDARCSARIPEKIFQRIEERFHIVMDGITRIERASGLKYPYYYILPELVLVSSSVEYDQVGIFFARTIPTIGFNNRLKVVIQITAPLVAYGLLGTVHAILAHEFLHYLELVRRIIKMNLVSDEVSTTLFEEKYLDADRLMNARVVFSSDPTLIRHISNRFNDGFQDTRLEKIAINGWIDKGLPVTKVRLDWNIIKIPFESMASLEVDDIVKEKIAAFERASAM
ncbi:MAG TPA: hypothetical protein VFI73_12800 [Candidatus Nitrosopolaris sp.]|nr:hypothetical protein [Candidatus Nitrosopolaris sp.]